MVTNGMSLKTYNNVCNGGVGCFQRQQKNDPFRITLNELNAYVQLGRRSVHH